MNNEITTAGNWHYGNLFVVRCRAIVCLAPFNPTPSSSPFLILTYFSHFLLCHNELQRFSTTTTTTKTVGYAKRCRQITVKNRHRNTDTQRKGFHSRQNEKILYICWAAPGSQHESGKKTNRNILSNN